MPPLFRHATLAAIDDCIYRLFRSALHEREAIERVIVGLTRAQDWWAFATVAGLIADHQRRRAWARANAGLGVAWAATKLISRSVARSRPNLHDCQPARHNNDDQSFPSTHTAVAFAATVVLPPLLPRRPLIIVATATAGGRLLLGEHYPSDVAAGAALGAAVAAPFAPRHRRAPSHEPHAPAPQPTRSLMQTSPQPDHDKLVGLAVCITVVFSVFAATVLLLL